MSKLPKINLVHAITDIEISITFNRALAHEGIHCLMTPGCSIYPSAIRKAQDIFAQYPMVSCIYTDHIIDGERVYYPAYTFDICDKITINTPMFCRSNIQTRFREDVTSLHCWRFLQELGKQHMMWHIPEALFELNTVESQ